MLSLRFNENLDVVKLSIGIFSTQEHNIIWLKSLSGLETINLQVFLIPD